MILFLSLYSSDAFYSEVLLHVCWGWRIFLSADLLQMLYFQLTWALRVVPLHRSSVQAAGYGWMLTGRWMWWLKKIWEHAETAQLLFFNCKTHTRIQTSICFSSLYNLRQAFNFKTTKIQTAWSHFVSSYLKKDKTSVTPSGHISHFLSGL